jgi:hypothetical protein
MVFIICNSDNTALRSFSTRDARNLGLKAICFHRSHKIVFTTTTISPQCTGRQKLKTKIFIITKISRTLGQTQNNEFINPDIST